MTETITWLEFLKRNFVTTIVAPIVLIAIMSRDATVVIGVCVIYAIILAFIGFIHSPAGDKS